jgi:hypothetical protein
MIGRTYYAKPMMERLLSPDITLRQAFAVAFLAFEATMTSVTDVGYPIDVIALDGIRGDSNLQRFTAADLEPISQWWSETLNDALANFPQAGNPRRAAHSPGRAEGGGHFVRHWGAGGRICAAQEPGIGLFAHDLPSGPMGFGGKRRRGQRACK